MLGRSVDLLRGEVEVTVRAPFPERVLNLCAARGIRFWDLVWEDTQTFSVTLHRAKLSALRRASENVDGCTVSVKRRRGVPFALGRLRRRYVLAPGLLLCAALAFASSFFVWDFSVSGNETVSREEILRVLEKNGVGIGTFSYSVDGAQLRNRVLLEIPELSWIAVNVRGCRAYVQVAERVSAPQLASREPANIVASKSGLVTRVQPLDGRAMVRAGETVLPGQLLISGVVETQSVVSPSIASRFLHARGSVYARTWYELSVHIPASESVKCYTEDAQHVISLVWGKNRSKIFGNDSSKSGMQCDRMSERRKLSLGFYVFPVTVVKDTLRPYAVETRSVSRQTAAARGEEMLKAYLSQQLGDEGYVVTSRCTSAKQGEYYIVTLCAECIEQIGTSVEIEVLQDETN